MSRSPTRTAAAALQDACRVPWGNIPFVEGPDPALMAQLDASIERCRAEWDAIHGAGSYQAQCDKEWDG